MQARKRIVIVGGGTGGLSMAARLSQLFLQHEIWLIEPSEDHYYQPYWTLAGAGFVKKEASKRALISLLPPKVRWIKDAVKTFNPDQRTIELGAGGIIDYDLLVVALGLELDFDSIKGARAALGKKGVCSIYEYDQLDHTRGEIEGFRGSEALFIMPPTPIKCAGAPQKIMYLAEALWRKKGLRERMELSFVSAGPTLFGIREFAEALSLVVARKGIKTEFNTRLMELRAEEQIAVFECLKDGNRLVLEKHYDFIHLVPPMRAARVVRESPLASRDQATAGWLAVDPYSLQHPLYPEVFGIGDITGIPNSKTGAAIRKQAPVVAHNIAQFLAQKTDFRAYDGYSSCPLITEPGKVILAEFGYGGVLMPTFPLNPKLERRLYWHLKKDLLPPMYWHGMLRGRI